MLERTDNRCTVVTSAPLGQAWRPAALDAVSATDLAAALAEAYGGAVEVTPLPVPSLQAGALAVLRTLRPPFSAVERAQLRVFAAAAVRTAHNARLFTLAETLRIEAELRERERGRLSDRLLRVEEGERRRLALALHDGPQQSIAGIGLIVQAAHDTIEAGEVAQGLSSLNRALEHCRGVVRSLRTLTFALEPITLRDHGFTAAFCELAGQLSESHKVEIVVDATAIDALDRQAQVSLYRIAQEATTNAVKHAGRHAHRRHRAHAREGRHRALHRRQRARSARGGAAARRHAPRRGRHARARLGRRRHDDVRGDDRRRLHRARDRAAATGGRGPDARHRASARCLERPSGFLRGRAAPQAHEHGQRAGEHHGRDDLVEAQRARSRAPGRRAGPRRRTAPASRARGRARARIPAGSRRQRRATRRRIAITIRFQIAS